MNTIMGILNHIERKVHFFEMYLEYFLVKNLVGQYYALSIDIA